MTTKNFCLKSGPACFCSGYIRDKEKSVSTNGTKMYDKDTKT